MATTAETARILPEIKKALREKGEAGLHDQRSKGNNLKFTNDVKNFAKGLIEYNRTMTSTEVQNAIKNKFGVIVSNTGIKNFRRENDLNWIRPKMELKPFDESGAFEIPIALALGTGLIDAITNAICQCVQKKRESDTFKESGLIQKDHPDLRSNGRFKFWIDFWGARNKLDSIFACYYIDGNTKALWSSKSCHKGKVTMPGRVMNCLEQVFIHDGQDFDNGCCWQWR